MGAQRLGLTVALALLAAQAAQAGDAAAWRHWRGPHLNGSADARNLPAEWSQSSNVVWRATLGGTGGSTPIVISNRVFVTGENPDTRELVLGAYDLGSGVQQWELPGGTGTKPLRGTLASPSPVADTQRVYAVFGNGAVLAVRYDGVPVWRRDLERDYGKLVFGFGYSSSPLLYDGRLYLAVIRRDTAVETPGAGRPAQAAYLLALDPATGQTLWRRPRLSQAPEESQEAYTSPIPFQAPGGPSCLVLYGGDAVTGHDPATGEEVWRWEWRRPVKKTRDRIITSPVVADGCVVICLPHSARVVAVRPSWDGRRWRVEQAWSTETIGSDSATPLVYNGVLYVLDGDRRWLAALAPDDGSLLERMDLDIPAYMRASPTGADGKLYCVAEDGTVVVVKAGLELTVLSRVEMVGQDAHASAVAVGERLLLRIGRMLYCVRCVDQ